MRGHPAHPARCAELARGPDSTGTRITNRSCPLFKRILHGGGAVGALVAAYDAVTVALVDRAVAARDPAAFGQLYDRFVERIYRYLYARCGSHADAEDLTEQVFLKAWQGIALYRWQGRPFQAWLYRLAHNAHIDHACRQRNMSWLDGESHPLQLESGTGSSELGARLDADLRAKAVHQLTPKQQQVIHLRFSADLDTREIAQIIGEQERDIRALQLLGLMNLRRVLDQQATRGPGVR
jgi:RNA polymerase sigma-70 factor (ECF subfamily)